MSPRPLGRLRLAAAALALSAIAAPAFAAPAQAAVVRPLDLVKLRFDPPGRDRPTNAEYNKEYVVVKNTGTRTLDLGGYRITDSRPHSYTFPRGVRLKPGATLTIRSGQGKNTASTRYWGNHGYVWNNTGDRVVLKNPQGRIVEQHAYKANPSGTVSL